MKRIGLLTAGLALSLSACTDFWSEVQQETYEREMAAFEEGVQAEEGTGESQAEESGEEGESEYPVDSAPDWEPNYPSFEEEAPPASQLQETPPPPQATTVAASSEAPVPVVMELDLGGQTPLAHELVPGMVRGTVYVTNTQQINHDPEIWVVAGEALTLAAAEPWHEDPLEFNYVQVNTAQGFAGEIQTVHLSSTPLNFSLVEPGTAEELIRNACQEALHAGVELHRVQMRHQYDIPSEHPDYHLRSSLENAFNATKMLVHGLIYGSNRSEDDLMREGQTRWTVLADDARILTWYSGGIPDEELKSRLKLAKTVLGSIESVAHFGYKLAGLVRDRESKAWLRGMEDLPPAKVEKLNEKKLAELDAEAEEAVAGLLKSTQEASQEWAEIQSW